MSPDPAAEAAIAELGREFVASGLADPRTDGVVMMSGGADSSALAAAAVAACGPQHVYGIHLNYGLRPDSGAGEEAARATCAKLRIDLHIERPELGAGNLQARAREARYEAAERLRLKLGAVWVATGHTRTDVVETTLYRLAVSPGARALLGLPPARGNVIRPLQALGRDRVRDLCRAAQLPFADDPSNRDPAFARNRIRSEVVPPLAEIGPELERNISLTRDELAEDARLIGGLASDRLGEAGWEPGLPLAAGLLLELEPALQRAVLTAMAERTVPGRPIRIDRDRRDEIVRLAGEPEGGTIELGRGVAVVAEGGGVRVRPPGGELAPPAPVELRIPGAARFGDWDLRAEVAAQGGQGAEPRGPEIAVLDAELLGPTVTVRSWRDGDRIEPLGMRGSKSLQDVFTDNAVPRSLRRRLPVVESNGRIAWVAGVVVSERFRLPEGGRRAVVLRARTADP